MESLIVGGDWNVTLNKIDKQGLHKWIPSSYRDNILSAMEELDLIDIMRNFHPRKKVFTYESKQYKSKSRLDFFLISNKLKQCVSKTDIRIPVRSDHKAIDLQLRFGDEKRRGPGTWKFNNTLLEDEEYLEKIRQEYNHIKSKYEEVENVQLLWELIKMEIRSYTIKYTKQKSFQLRQRERELQETLKRLDNRLCNLGLDSLDLDNYAKLKEELENIYKVKGERSIFRCKARWREQGEKPTKYFLNLEKRNYNRKIIAELKVEDDKILVDEKEILNRIQCFYEDLYTSKTLLNEDKFNQFVEDLNIPQLTDEQRESIEHQVTKEECKEVLKSFSSNKTPGCDGFTKEFYDIFFETVGDDLVNSYSAAFKAGELSISQKRGVITLIPKDDEYLLILENWRPITLLNMDYKVIAKIIAKRIETLLPVLIHEDQTGFVKERFIGENVRLINDVMNYLDNCNSSGILVAIDFKKAFDSLEWSFIKLCMAKFNFGDNILRWVSLFYQGTQTAVLNNGFMTDFFNVSRGVRQGCPLSPYLFILCAEILAHKIRKVENIKGIKIFNTEIKLSQFADDTTLFCADTLSVQNVLALIHKFGKLSGLCLNERKTKAVWLGKDKNCKAKPLNLNWTCDTIRILGTYHSYDKKKNLKQNFTIKVQKIQTVFDMWRSRDLTMFGKAVIIKALGISPIVYSMSMLEAPRSELEKVNKLIFKFFWKNKPDRIKREVLYQNIDKGGIKLPNIFLINKALRLSWISRLVADRPGNWKKIPQHFLDKSGGIEFLIKCNYDDKSLDKQIPAFYRNMLLYFKELKCLYDKENIEKYVLFNNKLILIDKKPVFWKSWYDNNIVTVQDLLKDDGTVMTYKDFSEKYKNVKSNFLQFYQMTSTIPKRLFVSGKNINVDKGILDNGKPVALGQNTEIDLCKMKCKDYYRLFIEGKYTCPTGFRKWSNYFDRDVTKECENCLKHTKAICQDTKVLQTTFKLLHRIIFTKRELAFCNIAPDAKCIYCEQDDSIEHCFFQCPSALEFISSACNWFERKTNKPLDINNYSLIFGIEHHANLIANLFITYLRHYIIYNKMWDSQLTLKEFQNKFNNYCRTLKINSPFSI